MIDMEMIQRFPLWFSVLRELMANRALLEDWNPEWVHIRQPHPRTNRAIVIFSEENSYKRNSADIHTTVSCTNDRYEQAFELTQAKLFSFRETYDWHTTSIRVDREKEFFQIKLTTFFEVFFGIKASIDESGQSLSIADLITDAVEDIEAGRNGNSRALWQDLTTHWDTPANFKASFLGFLGEKEEQVQERLDALWKESERIKTAISQADDDILNYRRMKTAIEVQ